MKELEKYRTWSVALVAAGLLALCALRGVKGEDLQAVKWGVVGIVATVAGRSVGRAAAGGGGVSGIARALTTAAKPDPEGQP